MNNKISLQELAAALAANMDVTKKTAESFIRHMFDIVQEYVLMDGQVKIKGFGTFKVVSVESRESVNVNTGERVLIEGHSKLTFTPDTTLRDQVNKPFADFTTVILNPNTSVEEMEAIEMEEEVSEGENELIEEKVQFEVQSEEKPEVAEVAVVGQEPEEIAEQMKEQDESKPVESLDEVQEEEKEEKAETEETENITIMQEEQTPVNHIEHQTIEQMTVGSQYVTNQTIQQMVASAVRQELSSRREILVPKRMVVWLGILFVVLLFAAFCGGYYVGSRGTTLTAVASVGKYAEPTKTTHKQSTKKTVAKRAATDEQATKAVEEKQQLAVAKPQAKEEKSQSATPKLTPSEIRKRAAEYEQMPDGEYLILGTKDVHIMSRGDNMYRIAYKVYGNSELASYIIFYNKFRNPDKVFLGAKVRLPELVKKE